MVETLLSMTFQIINFWWLFTIIFHNFRLVLDINSIDKGEYEWKNVYIRNIIKNNSNSSERAKIQDTYIKKAEIFILLIYLDMQFLLFVFTRYILHFLWGGGGRRVGWGMAFVSSPDPKVQVYFSHHPLSVRPSVCLL